MKQGTVALIWLVLISTWACGDDNGDPMQSTAAQGGANSNPMAAGGTPGASTGGAPASNTGGSANATSGGTPSASAGGAPASNNTGGAPVPNTGGAPAPSTGGAPIANTGGTPGGGAPVANTGGGANGGSAGAPAASNGGSAAGAGGMPPGPDPNAGPLIYKIGLSDVYNLKRGRVASLQYAEDVGADGVEADMGSLSEGGVPKDSFYAKSGEDLILDPAVAKLFVEDGAARGIECASVGMAGFFAFDITYYPFKGKGQGASTVLTHVMPDTLATMKNVGGKVAFLPARQVDWDNGRQDFIEQLQGIGKLAAAAGVVVGIETTLNATEEVKLLDEVGSPGIKAYFNISNPLEEMRDVSQELKIYGRDRIAQIHVSDRGTMRDHIEAVRDTLAELRWKGWLVIERAPGDGRQGFRDAVTFLKSVFPTE